jgi:hypothetical protein
MTRPTLSVRPVFRVRRVHLLGALALALGLAACGGGGGDSAQVQPPGRAGALAAAAPGELASWAQGRLRALDGQGRLVGGGGLGVGTLMPTFGPAAAGTSSAPPTSRTLVQEEGVDEADLLRANGRHLHALTRNIDGRVELLAQTLGSDNRLGEAQRLTLAADGAGLDPEGLIARGDGKALVTVAKRWEPVPAGEVCAECFTLAAIWMTSSVQLQYVDTTDPARPVAGTRLTIDGSLVDVRRVGDTLVVVAVHRPTLPVQALPFNATPTQRNLAIASVTADQLLPKLRRNGGAPQPLLRDTDCWLQGDNGSLAVQLTTVTLVNLANPELPQTSRCFAGGTEAVYLTTGNLWLATTRWTPLTERASLTTPVPPPLRTDVHQFALDLTGTGDIAYRGSAVIEGHLGWDATRKSYRFSEHEGLLRVITFTGDMGWASLADAASTPASPARLTVLRASSAGASADGRTLSTVAVLPNERRPAAIGKPGEQVYAVRFVGNRGYAVTFRRIDPLYVLDLADPADPRIAGEVELPGFSQMLLPLENGLLLGVGRNADDSGRMLGVQLTLFDVADAAAPRVVRNLALGNAGSASAVDFSRHGLTMRMNGRTAQLAMPVILTTGAYSGFQRGLQTFEVDTAARTLVMRGLLGVVDATSSPGWLGDERAVLMGDQAVHLRAGVLSAYDW